MTLLAGLASIASRALNVVTGGDADTTFSARVHIDGLTRLERAIDAFAFALTRERDHCRKAWDFDIARARAQIARDEARKTS
jgi:hypothetical protein